MKTKEVLRKVQKMADPFRVEHGKKFRIKDFDSGDTLEFGDEDSCADSCHGGDGSGLDSSCDIVMAPGQSRSSSRHKRAARLVRNYRG